MSVELGALIPSENEDFLIDILFRHDCKGENHLLYHFGSTCFMLLVINSSSHQQIYSGQAYIRVVFLNFCLDNYCLFSGLILSWVLPGQPGHNHVNGQTNDYIISKMAERGIVNEPEIQAQLRESLILDYLTRTAMVFKLPQPTNFLMH